MARAYASTRMEGRTFKHLLFRHAEPLFYVFDILWYEHVKSDDDPEQSIFRNDKDLRYVSLIGGSGCLTQQRSGERMSASRGQPTFPVEPRQELPSLNLGPRSALFGGCKMLGDISIAEVRVFFILVWTSAAIAIATVVLYRLHFRRAFAIAAYSVFISVALTAWAYFSIWGYVLVR